MGFDEQHYRAVIDKLQAGLKEMSDRLNQVIPAARQALAQLPSWVSTSVRQTIVDLANKIVEIMGAILRKLGELLKGAAAPITLAIYAYRWQDVRGLATGVAGTLKNDAFDVDEHWKGSAADAYVKAAKPQSEAAARIGTMADKTSTSLAICAAAGVAFYLTLLYMVVQTIPFIAAAIAAFGSIVFSWAGLIDILVYGGITTAQIIAAVTALTVLLTTQATQMASLHGEAIDGGAFPRGHWPNPTTSAYSDASVLDGDGTDWSLAH